MERKPIQVKEKTAEIIRQEAIRLSFKHGCPITMGEVIDQYAERLQKKHKFVGA